MYAEILFNLVVIIGCFAIVVTLLYLAQKAWCYLFGYKAIYFTGWIGTPVHELSHALVAILFGFKIISISLFKPEPGTGVLGYVEYQYNNKSLLHNVGCFWVGVAPLLGNIGLAALIWFVVAGGGQGGILQTAVVSYVCFALILHAAPSTQDLHNALPGLVTAIIAFIPITYLYPEAVLDLTREIILRSIGMLPTLTI